MDRLSRARSGLREMDALAAGGSPIHRLHPLSKLLVTVLYIVTVTSFPKYELSGLTVMVLYPVLLLQISEIPVSHCFYRLRFVLPLVCAVGLANPFLDRTVLLTLGRIPVTGGAVSMVTLMMKGTFSLLASFVLIAATPIDQLCAALRSIHVPGILATLLLLTYRYIGLMLGEAAAMAQAYQLRAPNQQGLHISAWGSFLGQLLLRSMDRAEELYGSMLLRGFHGEFFYVDVPRLKAADLVYTAACAAAFFCARRFNIPSLLGSLFVR